MTYKVDGIYTENLYLFGSGSYWSSNELFVKKGEVRIIDGKLHKLAWSSWWFRAWEPISTTNYEDIHSCIDARCVLKKVKKK